MRVQPLVRAAFDLSCHTRKDEQLATTWGGKTQSVTAVGSAPVDPISAITKKLYTVQTNSHTVTQGSVWL